METSLNKPTIVIMTLNRKHIERLDLKEVNQMMDVFRKKGLRSFKGRVVLEVDGYEDDPREIFEIPEIKAFYRRVFQKYPHLIYFLSPVNGSDAWILACLCDTYQTIKAAGAENVTLKMRFDSDTFNDLQMKTEKFMRNIGETPRSILELLVRLASLLVS
jgi:hypothetical protein